MTSKTITTESLRATAERFDDRYGIGEAMNSRQPEMGREAFVSAFVERYALLAGAVDGSSDTLSLMRARLGLSQTDWVGGNKREEPTVVHVATEFGAPAPATLVAADRVEPDEAEGITRYFFDVPTDLAPPKAPRGLMGEYRAVLAGHKAPWHMLTRKYERPSYYTAAYVNPVKQAERRVEEAEEALAAHRKQADVVERYGTFPGEEFPPPRMVPARTPTGRKSKRKREPEGVWWPSKAAEAYEEVLKSNEEALAFAAQMEVVRSIEGLDLIEGFVEQGHCWEVRTEVDEDGLLEAKARLARACRSFVNRVVEHEEALEKAKAHLVAAREYDYGWGGSWPGSMESCPARPTAGGN